MEIGGLVSSAFTTVFGNEDVMTSLLTFSIFISIAMIIYKVYEELRQ